MKVSIDIIEEHVASDPNRSLGHIIIATHAGQSSIELEIREASFESDTVDAVPDEAYDDAGNIDLDTLSEISEQQAEELMRSVRYLGDP